MKITYPSGSRPGGHAELDTSRLVIGTDGKLADKDPDQKTTPLTANAEAALRQQFGALLDDAIAAVKALA